MYKTIIVSVTSAIFLTASINCFALEAKKASEIVDVSGSFSDNCAGLGFGIQAATRNNPDGSQQPFSIPDKKVLVANSAEVLVYNAGANLNVQSRIFKGNSTLNIVSIQEKLSDAGGRAQFNYTFPSGIVIASGGRVCANSNIGTHEVLSTCMGSSRPPDS